MCHFLSWSAAYRSLTTNAPAAGKTAHAPPPFLRWLRGFVWDGHPASKRQYVIIVRRGEVDGVRWKSFSSPQGGVRLAEDFEGGSSSQERVLIQRQQDEAAQTRLGGTPTIKCGETTRLD
jgi:hypothetical protein